MSPLLRYIIAGIIIIGVVGHLFDALKECFKNIKEEHVASVIAEHNMIKRTEEERRKRETRIDLTEKKEIAQYIGKRLKIRGFTFNPQDYWEVHGGYRDETGTKLQEVYVGPAYKKILGFWQREFLVSIFPEIITRINDRLYWWRWQAKDRIE